MMQIEERKHKGELLLCKCYYSMRNGKLRITKVRPIKPRKIRKDKGIKKGPNCRTTK